MQFSHKLALLFRWPTFLYSILCLYWSVAILGLLYKFKWLNMKKKRNDVLSWAKGMKDLHQFTVLKVGERELYRETCMYLCNHRSWADFMVDQYVTEGRSLFMSRLAVVFVFPLFMTAIRAIRAVILFKRGSVRDKDAFNRWIDGQFARSPQTAIAVYPEGHRSTHGESLPLKRGMLHYAFSRKLPVQVVIGANKEAILSESHRTARLYQTVAVGFSDVIRPSDFADVGDFMSKVQATWDAEWNTVFSADWTSLPKLPDVEPQFDYPTDIRIYMLLLTIVNFVAAAGVILYGWRWTFYLLSFCGPFQNLVLSSVIAYIFFGFYLYSRPVDALTLHASMMRQVKKSTKSLDHIHDKVS